MARFYVWVQQTIRENGRIERLQGYIPAKPGDSFTTSESEAARLTLMEAAAMLESYDYESCHVKEAKLARIYLDMTAIDSLIGKLARSKPDTDLFRRSIGCLAVELLVPEATLEHCFQGGIDTFIDFINQEIASYA